MIHEYHDMLWIQIMKSMVVTYHSFLEAIFSNDCEESVWYKDQDAEEKITLESQLRGLLLPEVKDDGQGSPQEDYTPSQYSVESPIYAWNQSKINSGNEGDNHNDFIYHRSRKTPTESHGIVEGEDKGSSSENN